MRRIINYVIATVNRNLVIHSDLVRRLCTTFLFFCITVVERKNQITL